MKLAFVFLLIALFIVSGYVLWITYFILPKMALELYSERKQNEKLEQLLQEKNMEIIHVNDRGK